MFILSWMFLSCVQGVSIVIAMARRLEPPLNSPVDQVEIPNSTCIQSRTNHCHTIELLALALLPSLFYTILPLGEQLHGALFEVAFFWMRCSNGVDEGIRIAHAWHGFMLGFGGRKGQLNPYHSAIFETCTAQTRQWAILR